MNDLSKSFAPASPQVAHALKPGDTIMEYVIERTLGGGGFGITYLARDENLDLPVAVKEYLPGELALRAEDATVRTLGDAFEDQFRWGLERFLAEARVLATFRHPNIVRVLRYFVINGTAYIVMEYESGESLKHWLPRQGALNQASVLKLLYPLLDGLEVIHAANFLHRDIKPDNIYVRDDGSPVLIDFGSARRSNTDSDLTNIVSPGFAPFEQYHSKGKQGPWTDLYSLAAVMYWVISGTKPLDSLSRLKNDSMVPALQLDLGGRFGEPLLRAIDWALNPDETKRPQTVADFRKCLQEADGSEQPAAAANPRGAAAPAPEAAASASRLASAGENSGGNLVCSILFLDIIEYSKASVNVQYQLKSRFNQLISAKLAHIPETSRITLDTGDGASICFLGDPDEVLQASMDIRQALLAQDRLSVRMGLHIGPVRVIKDLNGNNNVIGDGINVAQRVMSFAESNSLVVSRAFYEIVARLTDRSAQSFRYLGERRDKHDRAHELYVVGMAATPEDPSDRTILFNELPDDKTILLGETGHGAGSERGGAGRAAVRAVQVFAQRMRSRILDAQDMIKSYSAQAYWWKLALLTLAVYGAGWALGGTAWGMGLALPAVAAGWLGFMRLAHAFFEKSMLDEPRRHWLLAASSWSGRNVLANSMIVLPSIAVVACLWMVLPARGEHTDAAPLAADPSGTPEAAAAKPNAVRELVRNVIQPDDAETQATLKAAKKMLAAKNFKAAMRLSRTVLKKHPGHASAEEIFKQAKAAQKENPKPPKAAPKESPEPAKAAPKPKPKNDSFSSDDLFK